MPKARARRPRRASPRAPAARRTPSRKPASGGMPPVPTFLAPEATAHAICRRCGRIVRVSVPPEDAATLQAFVDRRPEGWTVEGMSFSFTGICLSCREGRRE